MKKENVLFIEECFRNIQQEKEVDKNLRLIQSAIKREVLAPSSTREKISLPKLSHPIICSKEQPANLLLLSI